MRNPFEYVVRKKSVIRRSTQYRLGGVALLVAAAMFALISRAEVPPRAQMVEVSGQLGWWAPSQPGRTGRPTRFQLSGSGKTFEYHASGGDIRRVDDALTHAGTERIHVLIDARDEAEYPKAFEVGVGDRTVRGYDEVAAAIERDNQFGMCTAGILAAIALLMFWRGHRSRGT